MKVDSSADKIADSKVEFFYSQISADTERTFTPEQRQEIKKLIRQIIPVSAKKVMDVRFSFWFIKRMFAVIFIGVSRRKKERKSSSSGFQRFLEFEFKFAFYILEAVLCVFTLRLVFLLLKLIFGFNIIEYIF